MAHGRSIAGACPPGFNVQSNAGLPRGEGRIKKILTRENRGYICVAHLFARETGAPWPRWGRGRDNRVPDVAIGC